MIWVVGAAVLAVVWCMVLIKKIEKRIDEDFNQ